MEIKDILHVLWYNKILLTFSSDVEVIAIFYSLINKINIEILNST